MKTKFLLALLAINSFFLGSNSASATSTNAVTTHPDIANLSRTISDLVDLDSDSHSLMELAINRALLAQKQTSSTPNQPLINGISTPAIINGKIANPYQPPLINGKIVNPYQSPLINGIIANPNPEPPTPPSSNPYPSNPPLINGIIANPNPEPPTPPSTNPLINGTIAAPSK